MTEAEKIICRLYLEDMDKNHTCNEYKLLMRLLDKEPCEDVISRQDAIDAVRKSYDEILDFSSDGHTIADSVEDIINTVPPAQPEYLVKESGDLVKDLVNDCISRQDAIKAIEENKVKIWENHYEHNYLIGYNDGLETALEEIKDLPPAEPDKEKISNALYRIYLNMSPHTSADGVVAIKYHIAEIWCEIYGEEGPKWMI